MKKRLLLADDSVTIQKVVQITFSHDDYELTVVDNGEIAYEKARSQRPDLILADVFMPGKNGYELCAAVKNDPALSTVPVLLLTGTFEPFDEAKAKSVGADRWIAKPFESQALIACVEELLQLAAQAPVQVPVLAPVVAPPLSVATPLSSPAPEEDFEFVEPVLAADLPDDLWESDFSPEGTVESSDRPAADPFAATSQDDLWDVSGFESEGEAVSAADADDLWGGSFEASATPAFVEAPAILAVSESEGVDVDLWETDDFSTSFAPPTDEPAPPLSPSAGLAEISLADDVEVLEEIDLLEPLADVSLELAAADPFTTDVFSFEEESVHPEAVVSSPVFAPPAEAPLFVAPASLPVEEILPLEVAIPVVAAPSSHGATLSDAQLELIVERVAEVVISRLAGTLLEKIAWEVVPDLAETMIKEELRKIRESVAAE